MIAVFLYKFSSIVKFNYMNYLLRVVVSAIAVMILAYTLPGVQVDSLLTGICVALVLSILNVLVKPILVILTLPITIVTLGVFLLVINAFIIVLGAYFIDGFTVSNLLMALIFSLLLSVLQSVLQSLFGVKKKK